MSGTEFVFGIIFVSTVGWLINNWIRARHGYALEDEWGGKTKKTDESMETLRAENSELREQLMQFTDRVKVLERIVTDKSVGVANQIEALRDQSEKEMQP